MYLINRLYINLYDKVIQEITKNTLAFFYY